MNPAVKVFSDLARESLKEVEANGGPRLKISSEAAVVKLAYLVGAWLGDGLYVSQSFHSISLCGTKTLNDRVMHVAEELGLNIVQQRSIEGDSDNQTTRIVDEFTTLLSSKQRPDLVPSDDGNHCALKTSAKQNVLCFLLQRLGLFDISNKHLSEAAILSVTCDTDYVRIALLAGLVDSDGHDENGILHLNQKACSANGHGSIHELAHRAALSLGFHSSMSHEYKKQAGKDTVFRSARIVVPLGNEPIANCILANPRRADSTPYPGVLCSEHNRQLYGFKVSKLDSDEGAYVGIQVDGENERFLLADHTVVHNCKDLKHLIYYRE